MEIRCAAIAACGERKAMIEPSTDFNLSRQCRLPALAALDSTVQLAPGAADAHVNRGLALQQFGPLNDAISAHQHALLEDPAQP
jgi:hypothetical protein